MIPKLRPNGNTSVFHAREDIKVLMEYCNMLADHIDHLNKELEEVRAKLNNED